MEESWIYSQDIQGDAKLMDYIQGMDSDEFLSIEDSKSYKAFQIEQSHTSKSIKRIYFITYKETKGFLSLREYDIWRQDASQNPFISNVNGNSKRFVPKSEWAIKEFWNDRKVNLISLEKTYFWTKRSQDSGKGSETQEQKESKTQRNLNYSLRGIVVRKANWNEKYTLHARITDRENLNFETKPEDNPFPTFFEHIRILRDTFLLCGGVSLSNKTGEIRFCDEFFQVTLVGKEEFNLKQLKMRLRKRRAGHRLEILDSKLYVIGGNCETEYLSSCERFSGLETESEEIAPLNTPRSRFQSASHGGFIYVFGGFFFYGSDDLLFDGEKYDPSKNTWTVLKIQKNLDPRQSIPQVGASVFSHQGKLYCLGGRFDQLIAEDPSNIDQTNQQTNQNQQPFEPLIQQTDVNIIYRIEEKAKKLKFTMIGELKNPRCHAQVISEGPRYMDSDKDQAQEPFQTVYIYGGSQSPQIECFDLDQNSNISTHVSDDLGLNLFDKRDINFYESFLNGNFLMFF